ncbi:MAG: HpcH/HpaI aldolase/citrate lyase family protein [Bacteroidetes bacterium]|nr:HpcH/HpaI aldolase/citrate lyase family protein [Bacteroidota bacterium]
MKLVKYLDGYSKAGNYGGRIRSDCEVILEKSMSGGIQIQLTSKVKTMYGPSIEQLAEEVVRHFGFEHLHITIHDAGALPFVISARIEAAIRQLIETRVEYLPQERDEKVESTAKDKFRFSRLYLPGNTPSLMLNAGVHKPNGLILDLEDAVAVERKPAARILVRNALRVLDFFGAEKMVRINQVPLGLCDLEFVVPHGVQLILVPKCESAEQIKQVNQKILEIRENDSDQGDIWLMPIVESALGIVKAFEIASAASNVVALAIGLEDYTADMGCRRTVEGSESFYARSVVVNACKAAGIQAIDSVFSDVGDHVGLAATVKRSKAMGYDGMGCIHPRQIEIIHKSFAPEPDEIRRAQEVVMAFEDATQRGLGVVSLGTKMIDPPVVKRAERTVRLATELNLISSNWRNENE